MSFLNMFRRTPAQQDTTQSTTPTPNTPTPSPMEPGTVASSWRRPQRSSPAYWLYDDILQQPGHILIAGQTRSGKSVLLNSIIREMLLHSPVVNQLILIDPKRVELSDYKRFGAHCIAYASEPDDMVNALHRAMDIVYKRYGYMQQISSKKYPGNHIYIIIDELADLMLTNGKEAAPLLTRLGQVAAAARVHLICCTQYILSSVIPTPIKANFTAIIGLHARNKSDSRMIIGEAGLEALPQYGFCIYQTPGRNNERVKVPFVDDDTAQQEVDRLYSWWADPANRLR